MKRNTISGSELLSQWSRIAATEATVIVRATTLQGVSPRPATAGDNTVKANTSLQLYATCDYMPTRYFALSQLEPCLMLVAARRGSSPVHDQSRSGLQAQPFANAEDVWLWTMAALIARREGARYTANKGAVARPCDPDDVVKCLDALYRQRRISLQHARILRIWGERQMAPNSRVAAERSDHLLWVEALERLDWPLRIKGIVA